MASDKKWFEDPFPMIPTPVRGKPKDYKLNIFESTASDMVNAHNMLMRGLNAIYNQAPHVKPRDVKSFAHFCNIWSDAIEAHHHSEETAFFPAIEKMSGEKGVMDVNVGQHQQFHDSLHTLAAYFKSVLAGTEEYDGQKVVNIIDTFGGVLSEHLSAEITTLMGLERFGTEKMSGLYKALGADAKENMKNCGFTTGLPALLACHDETFEGGRWIGVFPPAPWIVLATVRNVLYRLHSDWHKFAPCDAYSRPKPQYAGPAAG